MPARSARGRRRVALSVAAAYVGALAAVAAVFLSYRIYVHHATFAARTFFWMGDVHRDDTMGFRMRAGRDGMMVMNHGLHDPARRIRVKTDAAGFRIPVASDAGANPSAGGIVAVGCSFTFGHGVAAESSYVYLAGEQLGLAAANLGVCAYSAVTSTLLLEQHIDALRPRVVVYGFGDFHLQRAAQPRAGSDLFEAYAACDGDDCRIESPARDNRLVFATQAKIEELYYTPRLAGSEVPFSAARLRALWPLATQDLRRALDPAVLRLRFAPAVLPETTLCRFVVHRLYDDCRRRDAEFVLLWFPSEFGDRPAPGLLRAVDELGAPPGFTFVDCGPALFAGCADRTEYSARWQVPRDGHPNRFMHLEMARAIATAVAPRLGLVPASH
jgi:hypothetical protein